MTFHLASKPFPRRRRGQALPGARHAAGLLACGLLLVPAAPARAQVSAASATSAPAAPTAPRRRLLRRRERPALRPAGRNLPVVRAQDATRLQPRNRQQRHACCRPMPPASASALMHKGNVDLGETPQLTWRWKIERSRSIDYRRQQRRIEGGPAPARLVFMFEKGDRQTAARWASVPPSSLPKTLAGREPRPRATDVRAGPRKPPAPSPASGHRQSPHHHAGSRSVVVSGRCRRRRRSGWR
ncbi:DUF3047 domain-containing protein [Cupriavidus basilensis]